MLKLITMPGVSESGEILVRAFVPADGFAKTAATDQLDPEIRKCIGGLKSDPAKLYVLVNAMGAGEFYSSNINGDWFEESELSRESDLSGYRTFLKAGVFRHHRNQDPDRSIGRVICSVYNRTMHRVELVIEIDREKARREGHGDLVEKLDAGGNPAVSMGCVLDPNYLVPTSTGYRPIESIAVGDMVLTHRGQWRRVTELHRRRYTGEVVTLDVRGLPMELPLTADHPMRAKVFSARRRRTNWKGGRAYSSPASFEKEPFGWAHAEHLQAGDHIQYVPATYDSHAHAAIASVGLARVMGFYLAEGSFTYSGNGPNMIQFACHMDDDLPRLMPQLLSSIFPDVTCTIRTHHKSKVGLSVDVFSAELARFMEKYLGHGAKTKFLPPELFVSSEEVKLAFLGAWLSGDGFVDAKGVHWSSANLPLMLHARDLLLSVGVAASIYRIVHKAGSGFSKIDTTEYTLNISAMDAGPLVPYAERKLAALPARLATRVKPGMSAVRFGKDGTYSYGLAAVQRHQVEEAVTYNFDVEGDESYTLAGLVSHNCRVPHDVCSICGNRAKTRALYCIHAKTMMNQVLPNGQKVYVTNPSPRFFDLSFVIIGADRTSYAMAKVARAISGTALSVDLAEQYGLRDRPVIQQLTEKLADRQKLSNLLKRVPAMSVRAITPITDNERALPDHVLDRLAQYPIEKALTTCSAAGIVLKPAEYLRLVLLRLGRRGRADELAKQGMVFGPAERADTSVMFGLARDYEVDLLDALRPHLAERSMFDPLLSRRAGREKTASPPETLRFADDPLLCKIASGYLGYRERLLLNIGTMVDTVTMRDPSLLSALSGQELEDLFVDPTLAKSASALPLALLGAVPLAYLYGAHRVGTGEKKGSFGAWIADHPVIAASILVGLTRLGMGLQQSGHLDRLLTKVVGG